MLSTQPVLETEANSTGPIKYQPRLQLHKQMEVAKVLYLDDSNRQKGKGARLTFKFTGSESDSEISESEADSESEVSEDGDSTDDNTPE